MLLPSSNKVFNLTFFLLKWAISEKNPNIRRRERVEGMKYPGISKKNHLNLPGLIKKEVKLPGMIKKKNLGNFKAFGIGVSRFFVISRNLSLFCLQFPKIK